MCTLPFTGDDHMGKEKPRRNGPKILDRTPRTAEAWIEEKKRIAAIQQEYLSQRSPEMDQEAERLKANYFRLGQFAEKVIVKSNKHAFAVELAKKSRPAKGIIVFISELFEKKPEISTKEVLNSNSSSENL